VFLGTRQVRRKQAAYRTASDHADFHRQPSVAKNSRVSRPSAAQR